MGILIYWGRNSVCPKKVHGSFQITPTMMLLLVYLTAFLGDVQAFTSICAPLTIAPCDYYHASKIPKHEITLKVRSTESEHNESKFLVNEFKPATMTLTKSMIFFASYLREYSTESRIKKLLSSRRRRGILPKLGFSKRTDLEKYNGQLLDRLKEEVRIEESEKKSLRQTLTSLNRSRKELIELVGYDASMLIPCFGFAISAAFMNSVIPHYYGACVTCIANAATTTQTEILTALTGLGISSALCALFTGSRGALFWLAGKANRNNNSQLMSSLISIDLTVRIAGEL